MRWQPCKALAVVAMDWGLVLMEHPVHCSWATHGHVRLESKPHKGMGMLFLARHSSCAAYVWLLGQ